MPLNGVNKLCAQCIRECKQWKQIIIVCCPFFTSKQHKNAKGKTRDTLQAQQNVKEARSEAIFSE